MGSSNLRVVLAGGGTGGHIIPALAVADEIVRHGGTVRFVGTRGRIEERLVPAAGYGIDFINVRPLAGGGPLRKVTGLASVPVSVLRAATLLRGLSPSVVMGVGGYVAGPVVLAARMMGIPTAFLEQNATLGLANKILKNVVRHAFVSYAETAAELSGGRAIHTGNPVKQQILDAAADKQAEATDDGPLNILVMGGSQGARAIDQRVPEAMRLAKLGNRVSVVHQGQQENLEAIRATYAAAGINAEVLAFIDDTASAYRKAGLVVARSGATTVSEVTVMGLPAIFLPYPHHKDRQQEKNASPMQQAGAAVVLDEKATGVEELSAAIAKFVDNKEYRNAAAKASASLGRPDAAKEIAELLVQMAK